MKKEILPVEMELLIADARREETPGEQLFSLARGIFNLYLKKEKDPQDTELVDAVSKRISPVWRPKFTDAVEELFALDDRSANWERAKHELIEDGNFFVTYGSDGNALFARPEEQKPPTAMELRRLQVSRLLGSDTPLSSVLFTQEFALEPDEPARRAPRDRKPRVNLPRPPRPIHFKDYLTHEAAAPRLTPPETPNIGHDETPPAVSAALQTGVERLKAATVQRAGSREQMLALLEKLAADQAVLSDPSLAEGLAHAVTRALTPDQRAIFAALSRPPETGTTLRIEMSPSRGAESTELNTIFAQDEDGDDGDALHEAKFGAWEGGEALPRLSVITDPPEGFSAKMDDLDEPQMSQQVRPIPPEAAVPDLTMAALRKERSGTRPVPANPEPISGSRIVALKPPTNFPPAPTRPAPRTTRVVTIPEVADTGSLLTSLIDTSNFHPNSIDTSRLPTEAERAGRYVRPDLWNNRRSGPVSARIPQQQGRQPTPKTGERLSPLTPSPRLPDYMRGYTTARLKVPADKKTKRMPGIGGVTKRIARAAALVIATTLGLGGGSTTQPEAVRAAETQTVRTVDKSETKPIGVIAQMSERLKKWGSFLRS
ncbi:hypothetical protein CO046_05475 [Candidatus Peregrinibacteria bacterium CG_4_9_14_0_2_um_filter_53_11]|nr:MAG: hypothetical protein CO046_05475 [Candidatus Peregrinibacteria bacterium CG_4_9_14_0_2_um_filter_53_11]